MTTYMTKYNAASFIKTFPCSINKSVKWKKVFIALKIQIKWI